MVKKLIGRKKNDETSVKLGTRQKLPIKTVK